MKNTITSIALIGTLIASITTSVVAAQDAVHFNEPIDFAGTGCPADSLTATVNGTTLSIFFEDYFVESELKRISCDFAVPVHVPAGWQVSLITADWRGEAIGEAELHREYFFAGQTDGINILTSFNDDYYMKHDKNYVERDSLEPSVYTACQSEDRDVVLRINSSIRTINDTSSIHMDTIDMDNKVVFKLNSRTCRRDGLPFIPLLLL
ncbi:MAG: DUF4360 domain-containing protein [Candidatus Electrothrix sp. AX2]|nr:DUF4360 domain-containing protein [Candidatus Electrothrix gigas]